MCILYTGGNTNAIAYVSTLGKITENNYRNIKVITKIVTFQNFLNLNKKPLHELEKTNTKLSILRFNSTVS